MYFQFFQSFLIGQVFPFTCCSSCTEWTCAWRTIHPQTSHPKSAFSFYSCLSSKYLTAEDYKVIAAPKKLLSSILNAWLNFEDQGRISCKFGPGCSERSNWDLIESYWHSTNYRHSPLNAILLVYNYLKQIWEFILFNHCHAS